MSTQSPTNTLKMLRLREAALAQAFHYTLYNPGDEPAAFECNGNPYVVPPDGPWTSHNEAGSPITVQGDGLLRVTDIRGVDRARYRALKLAGRLDKAARLPKDTLVLAAREVVTHALKKRGVRGLVLLTGDQERDTEIRSVAKAAWVDFRRGCCERTLQNYRERTTAFHADPRNRGQLPPPMTDAERAAQEWLDSDMTSRIAPRTYVCPVEQCGYDTDIGQNMARHMAARHPRVADDTPPTPEPAEPVSRFARRERGGEVKAP